MDDWSVSATATAAASGEAPKPAQSVTLTQARFFMDDGTWPARIRISAPYRRKRTGWISDEPIVGQRVGRVEGDSLRGARTRFCLEISIFER